ncbi:MAG: DUF2341 domain-containing protein, partial [Chloroflexi bacterium]
MSRVMGGSIGMLRRFAVLAALVSLLGVVPLATADVSQADWYDAGWAYRRLVTVSAACGEVTDYQVQVRLDSTFNFANAQPDGGDVRFTAADGVTVLPFWIETWDASGQTAILWVKVPTLPASGSTTLYLYYGNPDALAVSSGDD